MSWILSVERHQADESQKRVLWTGRAEYYLVIRGGILAWVSTKLVVHFYY